MWHVETDFFALAVFLIMFIKEFSMRKIRKTEKGMARDVQSESFYFVLVFSILSVLIDIVSSIAMNTISNWWIYQISMTLYVVSMPLLAAVWVGYAYVLIHKEYPLKQLLHRICILMIPYFLYILLALSNPCTGLFFKLSSQIQYERGILFMPVGVGFIMLYSLIGFLLVLFYWKKIMPRFNAILLLTFFVITAAFIWVQLAHPGWLIINASYAVIYVWCDIAIEDDRRNTLYRKVKEKNEELKIVAHKAESAAQAKSEFLSRMSHDIRTPMNAIIGLTYLAREEKDIERVRKYLDKVDSSSRFLLGLINDILDLSKIENGEMTLHESPFTCDEFKNSILTVIKPLIDEKDIQFIFEMRCGIECIKVDHLRFCQIFFNLLSNAAKFTPPGGTIEFVSERIEPGKQDPPGKVGIRSYVRDNGIGMSKEFQKHMYDPFIQEDSRMSADIRGTGLGLPIVKSLVDAMGGTIEVKSEQGIGTEFKIELYVETAEIPIKKERVKTARERLHGCHALLAEDNELNMEIAEYILRQAGIEVTKAANGQEAREAFAQSEPGTFDVILMDIRMPILNGWQATAQIRAMDRRDAASVPIIAMSANAFEEDVEQSKKAGMNDHITKPLDVERLFEAIANVVDKKK